MHAHATRAHTNSTYKIHIQLLLHVCNTEQVRGVVVHFLLDEKLHRGSRAVVCCLDLQREEGGGGSERVCV